MNHQQAMKLAAILEESTYETHARDGLLKDLRSGRYRVGGTFRMPFESLMVALSAVDAPPEVLAEAKSIRDSARADFSATSALPDDLEAAVAATMAACADWKPPTAAQLNDEMDELTDAHLADLIPASKFLDGVSKERDERLAQESENMPTHRVGEFTSPQ